MVLSDCIILLLDTDRLVLSIFTPTYYLPRITVSYSWSACQVLKNKKLFFTHRQDSDDSKSSTSDPDGSRSVWEARLAVQGQH
jgi:hypothetical protein